MSKNTTVLTRPTTSALRAEFSALSAADRKTVAAIATKSYDGSNTVSACWKIAFNKFSASKVCKPSNSERKFQREVGHRLVTMRANGAACSCGLSYEVAGSAAQRAAHAEHKAELV